MGGSNISDSADSRCAEFSTVFQEAFMNENLDLEVLEVEKNSKPGCTGSSSTSPRCTCPVRVTPLEETEQ
jgi:hypothetical protein